MIQFIKNIIQYSNKCSTCERKSFKLPSMLYNKNVNSYDYDNELIIRNSGYVWDCHCLWTPEFHTVKFKELFPFIRKIGQDVVDLSCK